MANGNSNSNSNSNSNGNGNGGSNSSSHNGVADYFAILGTGEKLTLKSTQKKLSRHRDMQQQQQQQQQAGNDTNDTNDTNHDTNDNDTYNEELKAEEECAMMERFYREIIQLCIVSVYSNANGDYIAAQLSTAVERHSHDHDGDHDHDHGGASNGASDGDSDGDGDGDGEVNDNISDKDNFATGSECVGR